MKNVLKEAASIFVNCLLTVESDVCVLELVAGFVDVRVAPPVESLNKSLLTPDFLAVSFLLKVVPDVPAVFSLEIRVLVGVVREFDFLEGVLFFGDNKSLTLFI